MKTIEQTLINETKARAAVEAARNANKSTYAVIMKDTKEVWADALTLDAANEIVSYYQCVPGAEDAFEVIDTENLLVAEGQYTDLSGEYGHQEPAFRFYGETVTDCEALISAWAEKHEAWYVNGTRCAIEGEDRNDLLGRKELTEEQWEEAERMFKSFFEPEETEEDIYKFM